MVIPVYQVKPASSWLAGWVTATLTPVLQAVRADGRPIVFKRVGGGYSGFAPGGLMDCPDGHISLSHKVEIYSKAALIQIYIHELAHALVDEAEAKIEGKEIRCHGHDSAFLALQLVLCLRVDKSNGVDGSTLSSRVTALSLGLYDIQDPPPALKERPRSEWVPQCISWAMKQADTYIDSDASALDCAVSICTSYWSWVADLESLPAKQALQQALIQSRELGRVTELSKLRSDLQLMRGVAATVCLGFMAMFYLCLK